MSVTAKRWLIGDPVSESEPSGTAIDIDAVAAPFGDKVFPHYEYTEKFADTGGPLPPSPIPPAPRAGGVTFTPGPKFATGGMIGHSPSTAPGPGRVTTGMVKKLWLDEIYSASIGHRGRNYRVADPLKIFPRVMNDYKHDDDDALFSDYGLFSDYDKDFPGFPLWVTLPIEDVLATLYLKMPAREVVLLEKKINGGSLDLIGLVTFAFEQFRSTRKRINRDRLTIWLFHTLGASRGEQFKTGEWTIEDSVLRFLMHSS